jgi:leader peptidase (prepilin peptidase) / N-methyltransferase
VTTQRFVGPTATAANAVAGLLAAGCAIGVVVRAPHVAESYVTAVFVVVLVVLARIDIERRILPNRILLPAVALILAAQIALYPSSALVWIIAAVVPFALFLILAIVAPHGMGMGDVKLMLLLGVGLGRSVTAAIVVGVVCGAIWSLVLLAVHRKAARRRTFAYGPFLAAGAIAVALAQPPARQVAYRESETAARTIPSGSSPMIRWGSTSIAVESTSSS